MTSEEFRAARAMLRMSTQQMADALGLGEHGDRTVQRIEHGAKVTGPMGMAVERMLQQAGLID